MFEFLKKLFKKTKKTESHTPKHRPAQCPKAQTAQSKVKPEEPVIKPECECQAPKAEPAEAASVSAPEVNEAPAKEEPEKVEAVAETEKTEEESPYYSIKQTKSGAYMFTLKTPKGATVVNSGEYTLKRSCVSGIQSVRSNGTTENIEDQTEEGFEKKPNPKYEISATENGKFKYILKAPNGYVILESPEYTSKNSCVRAITGVKKNSYTEVVEDTTKTK